MIDGAKYPRETRLVQKSVEGGPGVIAVLFEEGEGNPVFSKFWDFLPREEGDVPSDLRISANEIIPEETNFYTFDGSWTTRPCSGDVKWYVMQETV